MKKKLMTCLLVVGLALSQVLCVGANPSKGNDFDITDDSKDDGYEIETEDPSDKLDELPEDIKDQIKDKVPVSPGIIIKPNPDAPKVPSLKDPDKLVHRLEFYIPDISDDMLPDFIGVYWDGEKWVVIESVFVDFENQIIMFEFDELPEWMIIFGELISAGMLGESPKTGVTSTWMTWAAGAVILGAAAMVVSRKKRA